jgi:CDGSH-type Zn-finger protein/truncated hemoglobin YjbI
MNEPDSFFEVDILTQLINSDVPQDRSEGVDVGAAREGIRLLLAAGRVHAYDSCHFQETRALHRKLVILGAKYLGDAVNIAPTFDLPDQPQIGLDAAWIEFLQWSSTTELRMFEPLHPATDEEKQILTWLKESIALLGLTAKNPGQRGTEIARVLVRSVIRALCEALAFTDTGISDNGDLDRIIQNAALTVRPLASEKVETLLSDLASAIGGASEIHRIQVREAAAALARLVSISDVGSGADILAMFARLSSAVPRLTVMRDGPYLFEGAAEVKDYLGIKIESRGRSIFCRCGQSASKPFCDGSHAMSGFHGDKDPRRIADVRDSYVGQQATVLDNRGLCAHSGFCTDRLNGVFHVNQEPFVTPSGGRLDDIMRAVRRCPSGALSVAVDGNELREYVDESREPSIEISKDGPYRITGAIVLVDEDGNGITRNAGASEEHYSLCRCGSSLNKPFCSGMHWSVSFTDPRVDSDREPTLFEWAGGYPALLEMTRLFYSRHVPSDPLVGPLFARMEADHPERVAAWLSEVFGGPPFYTERYGGYTRMISQHLDKHLTQEQRSHWAMLMAQSADEAGLPNDPEFRAAFIAYIEWGSRIAVENSTSGAKPPENMPVPRWWWVCNAKPGARIAALQPQSDEPISPAPILSSEETPSFAKHIKSLFRPVDRNSMRFAFDLWSYEDVHKHAEAILERVRAGTMPCDGPWAQEKVELFQRWVDAGKKE